MFNRIFATAWCYTTAVWSSFGSGRSRTVACRRQPVSNILLVTG